MSAAPRPAAPAGELGRVLDEVSVVVCAGSGGVGKTTTAAALALEAARRGRHAVVVTIDPARRLADALGLDELSSEPHLIDGPGPGSLWALMLDTKVTFDSLVRRYASSEDQVERILANRFYRNISHALSGTQEYMAAEKLYELHESDRFDLVVVDTPPTRNALDFLDAPNQLARLLDHRVYKVLTAPGRGLGRVVNLAAQNLVRTVGRIVGAGVIDDAVAFFAAFEGMEEGFRGRSQRVQQLLGSPETAFVLVAAPRADTVEEAEHFAGRLRDHGIGVRAMVVNRATPAFTTRPLEALRTEAAAHPGTGYAALVGNLADFAVVAEREREHLAALAAAVDPAPVVRVPLLGRDVHDLDGLRRLAELLVDPQDPRSRPPR